MFACYCLNKKKQELEPSVQSLSQVRWRTSVGQPPLLGLIAMSTDVEGLYAASEGTRLCGEEQRTSYGRDGTNERISGELNSLLHKNIS